MTQSHHCTEGLGSKPPHAGESYCRLLENITFSGRNVLRESGGRRREGQRQVCEWAWKHCREFPADMDPEEHEHAHTWREKKDARQPRYVTKKMIHRV